MRILHITAQKPDSTGSGTYLAQLVAAFNRLGYQQAVVCGIDKEDVTSLPENVSVFPVRFRTEELPFPVCGMSDEMPYLSTRYRDMTSTMVEQFKEAFAKRILEAASAIQPDLVICNHLYIVSALTRQLLPDTKVCAICHSTCLRQLMQHNLERSFIIDGVKSLDVIFALHKQQKDQIIRLFNVLDSQVQIVGTGYDDSEFNQETKLDRVNDLVYVGKISFKKGVASLVKSLDLLPESVGTLKVRLVGGAGNQEELAYIADLAEKSRHEVSLLGKVDQDDLVREYRSAKTFVLPSFYEGLPLVTIEAMACGCNVVVTNLPGVKPWLSSNVPEAIIDYVSLPAMEGVDQPVLDELPAFEERLANAIEDSLSRDCQSVGVSHLSWDSLAQRIVSSLKMDFL